jgi:hypothetical protein
MDRIPFSVYDFFAYLFSGAVVLAAVDYIYGTGILLQKSISPVLGAALVIFAYVTGQIVAHISASVLEHFFIKRVLQLPSLLLLNAKPRWVLFKWIFPNYHCSLPENIREQVLKTAQQRGCHSTGEGLFLHIYPIVTANDRVQARLDEFRNQYGFSRNMCFAFLIAGVAIAISHKYGSHAVELRWSILAIIASVSLFYRYLKFFRQYSYELFIRYSGLPIETSVAVGHGS